MRGKGFRRAEDGDTQENRRGLTCCNVAVSVFVIVELVVTGIRGVPW